MIPKIIHYCWFGRKPLPQQVKDYIATWRKHCPDYKIKEWNEENFDINSTKWTKEAYAVKKYAFVSDYVRLYALYYEGGIYLDTDIEVLKTFDNLLNQDYFIGYEHYNVVGTGVIASIKGGKFIKNFLDLYQTKSFINDDGTINNTPNTRLLMNYITENHLNIKIYDIDYFCAKNYQTGKIEKTARTYCIHHYSASWKPWYARFEMRICNLLGIKYKDFLFRKFSK